jgi:peptidyl-prolyl cis-trans isomerase A (cyclophilin A)
MARLLLLSALLLTPLLMGQAKACPEGKTLGWDQMTCCWPGQNVGPFGCTGKPTSCPDGLVPTGDGCAKADSLEAARNAYHPGLLDPNQASETAPDTFAVLFETTAGDMIIDVTREWAPVGADRFYNLVRIGYYDGAAFFRVIEGFMAQVGLHGDPKVNAIWRISEIEDDPAGLQSNLPGFVSFAMAGPNSRTTQIFLNLGDNHRLDRMGFAPFGQLRDMEALHALYAGYGEGAPGGNGPDQRLIQDRGAAYLQASFPKLDSIRKATIVPWKAPKAAPITETPAE